MCLVLSPPCTRKSAESEPGLEPKRPLCLLLSEVQAELGAVELGTPSLRASQGCFCPDGFAVRWPRVETRLCAYQPSLSPRRAARGRKRRQAGRQAGTAVYSGRSRG